MSKGLEEAIKKDNLNRAWRWIKSNPDRRYKKYFRDFYASYSLIEDFVVDDIYKKIKENTYEPSHGCKVYIPKASGVLRPYTLLTIQDQIVYQALVNVVAEQLLPKVKNSYYKTTFGNLYAGTKSIWFYRKWSDGYSQFNNEAKKAFAEGLKFTASFDLTACYDSLDHNVLSHFLKELKFDNNFITFLTRCLSKWTGNESTRIYHHHGIPQGPLASGLLSEVALKYFDIKYGSHPKMRYMRYVDDIRLFASSERELREMLVHFDRLSKDIGLFPQSSKIEIHEVKNINDELKSISNPSEIIIKTKIINQQKVQKRLVELTSGYKIYNTTRFKYILAHAEPSYKINTRIWKIFKKQPSNYESIFSYFQRYKFLPVSVVNMIIKEINSKPVYSAITAGLFETLAGRVKNKELKKFKELVKKYWKPGTLVSEVELHSVLAYSILKLNLLTNNQLNYALKTPEWYVRACLTKELDSDFFSPATLKDLLNKKIRDLSSDVAIVAAVVMIKRNISVSAPYTDINLRAAKLLKDANKIGRLPSGIQGCSIEMHLNQWLDNEIKGINWKTVFGSDYQHAQTLAFECRLRADIDITAWVNAMDVFNDLLLKVLSDHDPNIGRYTLGTIGGYVLQGNAKLEGKYPSIFKFVKSIHAKRGLSNLSHAVHRSSGKPTGPVKHAYYKKEGKSLAKQAFKELAQKW